MAFNGILQLLLLDADVALCHGSAAVLQELLDQRNIVVAVFVNLRCVILSEAMCADTGETQIVADGFQMLLYRPFRDREYEIIAPNAIIQTVASDKLIQRQRNGKHTGLSGFLLYDGKTIAVAVLDNIAQAKLNNVRDAQTQVCFQHECRCRPWVRTSSGEALLHG